MFCIIVPAGAGAFLFPARPRIPPSRHLQHRRPGRRVNLRAPFIKEWLGKTIGSDDLERHDKWLCMMMPRLILLRELLADDGLLFISIDDNEHCALSLLVDEIFGDNRRLASFVWKKNPGELPTVAMLLLIMNT